MPQRLNSSISAEDLCTGENMASPPCAGSVLYEPATEDPHDGGVGTAGGNYPATRLGHLFGCRVIEGG